jgi:flagellar hook assembly protein FlgD
MESGNTIEFIFMLKGLPCVRLEDSSDIRSYEPFSFQVQDIRKQKGGVTILNNIINPLDGDEAVLIYELPDAGIVTAQIFALNGSMVRILHRGRQAAGTYQYLWDGRNNSGQVVARGVYFIRVVGPEMDEIRKVLVVK